MKLTYSILKGTVTFEWTPEEQKQMTEALLEGTARTFARLVHSVRVMAPRKHDAEGFGDDHIDIVAENLIPSPGSDRTGPQRTASPAVTPAAESMGVSE